jgi:hypothetical protein
MNEMRLYRGQSEEGHVRGQHAVPPRPKLVVLFHIDVAGLDHILGLPKSKHKKSFSQSPPVVFRDKRAILATAPLEA